MTATTRMANLFYRFITFCSKYLGAWFFRVFSRFVATGYFILFPARVAIGVRFYRALFPERGRAHHLWSTLRQFNSFTDVFLDRFLLELSGEISYTSDGWERMEETLTAGTGGIIVMSHMGNWDVAAHLLRKRGMDLLLYLGARQKEQLEKMQKQSLAESGLRVVTVDREGGSPFDILEGLGFLRKGGLISLAGDRLWTAGQRSIGVSFLGGRALLPEAPHALALLSGAPLFYLFAIRGGGRRYRITARGPYRVAAPSRSARDAAIRESAQRYADILAAQAREHPEQWYHFEEFLTGRA